MKRVSCVFAALLLTPVCALGGESRAFEEYNRAVAAAREGNARKALTGYMAALSDARFASEHPEAYYWAGQAAVLCRDARAAPLLEKALELCGDVEVRRRARYWLAEARVAGGDYSGALAALDGGETAAIYWNRTLLLRLRIMSEIGGTRQVADAVNLVLQVKDGDDGLARLLPAAAERIRSTGGWEDVRAFLVNVVKKAGPESRRTAAYIGAAEAVRAGKDDAVLEFLAAANDKSAAAALAGAVASMKKGDYDTAETAAAPLLNMENAKPAAVETARRVLVELHLRKSRPDAALAVLKESNEPPWRNEALIRVLRLAAGMEDWKSIIKAGGIEWLGELSPGEAAEMLYLSGWAYMKTGMSSEGARFFLRFAEHGSGRPEAPEALFLAAACFRDAGREDAAVAAMKLLTALYPDSVYAKASEGGEPAAIDVNDLAGDKSGVFGNEE